MTHELRNLRITKIALVRKGYRPVNDGARITIVKAEEDTMSDTIAEASVLERISKALAGLLKGDGDPVEKAAPKVSNEEMAIAADGSHSACSGTHDHGHVSHYAVQMHNHSHEHDHDGDHYHDHVVKADGEHEHELPEGWRVVTVDELRPMLSVAAPVEKAEPDPALSKLVEDFTAAIQGFQTRTEAVEKATVSEERITELVTEQVKPALETALKPIAKSIEDMAIAFSRTPRTPNVTTDIRPGGTSANGEADREAVKGMAFSDAVRYLTAPRS